MSNKCLFCKKEAPKHHNYCGFECHIEDCKKAGYIQVTPNNLPIKCITGDGKLLECEGGDHPNYIKPVEVKLTGYHYNYETEQEEFGPQYSESETHTLIFQDEVSAITLYETCYFFWIRNKLKYTGLAMNHYIKYDATLETKAIC